MRGSGNCADINKKKKQLWINILTRVNSEHGNARSVDEIRKKWTNLKLAAKSKVDSSFREARKTGGGSNQTGIAENEEMMFVSAEKCLSNSDRVTDMFKDTPAFSGVLDAVDLFQPPCSSSTQPLSVEIDSSILESPEVDIQQIPRPSKMNRKRKRPHSEWESAVEIGEGVQMQAADLLPLQKDVLEQQMKVFPAQLQLIEEQGRSIVVLLISNPFPLNLSLIYYLFVICFLLHQSFIPVTIFL